MLTREELIEMKFAVNEIIASRLCIKYNSQVLNEDNEKYLKMDYELLDKIIKTLNE